MEFGAAVTLTRVLQAMQGAVKTRPPRESEACAAVVGQLRWFAGTQIRNVASLGGNVCTASPISDLNPLWMASRATFTVVGTAGKTRQVAAENFFLGYRQVDLREGEVLLTVSVPWYGLRTPSPLSRLHLSLTRPSLPSPPPRRPRTRTLTRGGGLSLGRHEKGECPRHQALLLFNLRLPTHHP